MPDGNQDVFSSLADALKGELSRTRETLVPPAFQFLWTVTRFLVAYGGRASAKSWSIARVLIVLAHEQPLRILCTREIQGSIKESAYRLLVDQIDLLGLNDHFDIGADTITHKNGSRFFFEGLRYNTSRIRSYESIDITWCEEAQSISEFSWETLLPTIRKPGSRFLVSFNPLSVDDPVLKRFVLATPPGCIARKVSYLDNPFFSPESEQERAWLEQTDPDSYRHVWLGETRTISDAQIFKNKFTVDSFDINPAWAGPYHGVDFGFSKDPSAGVRCHIDDVNRVLYISKEFWKLGCDIDALSNELESAIPGISKHTVYCDSSRPETISYMSRSGIANARAAEKWPGSIDDGVMYLRSFAKIVIDPSCVHTIDEFRFYSFKTDRLTGAVLPEVSDRHNHCIDALRYSIHTLIRNQAPGGYFSRAALLVGGEAVEVDGRPQQIFAVLSTTDRPGSAAGLVVFAYCPHQTWPLIVLSYDLVEVETALDEEWLEEVFARMRKLSEEYRALSQPALWVERVDTFGEAVQAIALNHAAQRHWQGPLLNVCAIQADTLALTIDERASQVRTAVNGGRFVKLSRSAYLQQSTFRSSTTNHFTAQIFGYRPEARDTAQELVNALCVGISICSAR
jgi:phage terminase large subunit